MPTMPERHSRFHQHFVRPERILPPRSESGESVAGSSGPEAAAEASEWLADEAENRACGDWVRFRLQVRAGRLAKVGIQVRGCSATIACASLVAEAIEGSTLEEARALDVDGLARESGANARELSHAPAVVARALEATLARASQDCQAGH